MLQSRYNYVPCIRDAFTRKINAVQLWYVQIYLCSHKMCTFYTIILYHNYTSLAPPNLVGDSSNLFTCIFSCTQFTSHNYASFLFGVNTSQKHACWHVIMWYNYVPCIWDAFTRKINAVQLWYVQIYLCYVYYSKAILIM
jgi:hypothetical protein